LELLEAVILVFFGSFILTYFIIPRIIGVVEYKNLMDDPNERSSHATKTPTLGGIAFYCTLSIIFFFLKKWDFQEVIYHIIPGLTILFIIGLKDDLVVLSPTKKLIAQICAIIFVLTNSGFTIISLNGFFGIEEIPLYVSYIIGGFMMLTIINAYNLIDGIDGLAAIVGIIIVIIYCAIFYLSGNYFYALLCLALNGSLVAFLSYNLSSSKKIFMGDTGSLIVGFIISILSLKFLALSPKSYESLPFLLENIPLIAISILIVPLFDTARVFTVRLANKKSPFSPDRNHTHHILIDYFKISHRQASFIIGGFNLIFVLLFIILGSSSYSFYLMIVLVATVIILGYLFYRFDYSFANIKRKIFFRKKVESLKKGVKRSKEKLIYKKDKENK